MKRLFLAATILTCPTIVRAQTAAGPYVSLGAGVNFLQNEFEHPVNGFGPTARSYVFDPGFAGFASVGYALGNGLRLEVEGDYGNNHVRKADLGTPERAGGYEQQYGGFVNALYDFNLHLPVVPYVGVGVGYQEVELDGVNSSAAGVRVVGQGSERAGNFAYQAIAGASYPLAVVPGLSLTAEYRFIGVQPPGPAYDRGATAVINGARQQSQASFTNIFNHEVLFGVRYAFNQAPPPPPPVAPQPAMAPAPTPARTYLVFFDWDRADLTQRARSIIGEAAQASTRVQSTRIEVNGYTDKSGTAAYNQRLSVRRAEAVAAELVRDGVARGAISIQGFGETNPLVPTAEGVREPQNRRVEIILR